MAVTSIDPFFRGNTGRSTRGLLRLIILCAVAAAAVSSRLFSVISMSTAQASIIELYSGIPILEEVGSLLLKVCANTYMQDSRVSSTNVRIYLDNEQDHLQFQLLLYMCPVHN